jgi:hypothetical protein
VRALVRELDPAQPISTLRTGHEAMALGARARRVMTEVLGADWRSA